MLEFSGSRVINRFETSLICGNKLFVTAELLKKGVRTPRTYVAFSKEGLDELVKKISFPFVVKPVVGSWGRLSALVKDNDSLNILTEHREFMYPIYHIYYVQEYIEKPQRDIRSFVLNGRTIAAIYRVSSNDWRTNTARGGKALECKITGELDELSVKSAEAVQGEFVGVDIMESREGLVVHEVNANTEFKNTVPATGINIPSLLAEYIHEKLRK